MGLGLTGWFQSNLLKYSGGTQKNENCFATSLAAGTLYLFDRKSCRYFRKDGHNWRKKKDGKTVRETHEKLKVRVERGVRKDR